MNFRLHPSMELHLRDIFKDSANYLEVLSRICINDLHRQQPSRWENPAEGAEQLKSRNDESIRQGAAPTERNYERLSLRKNGIVVHFDPYHVGSFAEGKHEVFIPAHEVKSILKEEVAAIVGWN
jgi:Protein of unknown function (DUF3298)